MSCTSSPPWFTPCTSNPLWKAPLCILDGLMMPSIVLVIVMWWMKARMLLSYRVIAGWQSISLILYSSTLSHTYESEFALLSLGKSNGPFIQSSFSTSYTFLLPTFAIICAFISFLLLFYSPASIFIKKSQSYLQYLKQNAYRCLQGIYLFGSRLMLFWVGGWIQSGLSGGIASYVVVAFIGVIILIVIGKTFYDYHAGSIDHCLQEPHLHLYCILSPLSMFGLQLAVSSSYLPILIYLLPLGLLFLILLLTLSSPIFTKEHVLFYLVEGAMAACAVLIYIVGSSNIFIMAAAGYFGFIVIAVQSTYLYYGGFSRNSQVYPEKQINDQQNNESAKIRPANILKIQDKPQPKASYF